MPAFTATAPGKIILFGEHAVVYGEPALAAPVPAFQARAIIRPNLTGQSGEVLIEAPDIGLSTSLAALGSDHPLKAAIIEAVGEDSLPSIPACQIQISSTIPLASGLGSSAAISSALIRSMAGFVGQPLSDQEVSQAAFEVEKIHHGTPSGIDNNVVVYEQPLYFQKGKPLEFLQIQKPFQILIVSSGSPGNTRDAVAQVRENWKGDPDRYNLLFSEIGEITRQARGLILRGDTRQLGPLLDQNHKLLQELGVSTPALDNLVLIAKKGGALGAKLSGGGLGGYLTVLIDQNADTVTKALQGAGAPDIFKTTIGHPAPPARVG